MLEQPEEVRAAKRAEFERRNRRANLFANMMMSGEFSIESIAAGCLDDHEATEELADILDVTSMSDGIIEKGWGYSDDQIQRYAQISDELTRQVFYPGLLQGPAQTDTIPQ